MFLARCSPSRRLVGHTGRGVGSDKLTETECFGTRWFGSRRWVGFVESGYPEPG